MFGVTVSEFEISGAIPAEFGRRCDVIKIAPTWREAAGQACGGYEAGDY